MVSRPSFRRAVPSSSSPSSSRGLARSRNDVNDTTGSRMVDLEMENQELEHTLQQAQVTIRYLQSQLRQRNSFKNGMSTGTGSDIGSTSSSFDEDDGRYPIVTPATSVARVSNSWEISNTHINSQHSSSSYSNEGDCLIKGNWQNKKRRRLFSLIRNRCVD